MASMAVEILLVEDNPDDVELTRHVLEKHKVTNRIHVAGDGVEALDYLFCTGPHASRSRLDGPKVILLDLKLPRVDGLQVLGRIKADPDLRTIPVVVMTSSREERDLIESYRLGVNSYIVKPVDFQQFGEAVRQVGLYWVLLNQPPASLGG
jgi:two-component system, response regulator